ncbi:hypothetical protein ACFQY7_03605 [Actinomadura luteofluorescens]|uniref:hypothetical protein n=1 Tax=Actinomadura luteofluorescens TaxID=46163 RepID=UPI003643FFE3
MNVAGPRWDPIAKAGRPVLPPNLDDYEKVYDRFRWDEARAAMDGLPGGRGLNIAHEAVDRHAEGPLAGRVALRCLDRHDRVTELTYARLRDETCRFANVLRALESARRTGCSPCWDAFRSCT